MITGKVTNNLEVVVELVIIGLNHKETIECIVDTGFSGYLALPSSLIQRLNLKKIDDQEVVLADGSTAIMEKYLVKVLWHGEERSVSALRADGGPITGMFLLHGSRVILDVVEDGDVSIDALPQIR